MGSKTPTRLLRVCKGESAPAQEGKDAVEFTPLCAESLKQCFLKCDVDEDRKLSYTELSSFFSFTTGDELSEDQFEGLVDVLEGPGTVDRAVSFNGLLELYKMNYKELGMDKGDSLLWKDLSKFGFNADLTHSGKWPNNKGKTSLDTARLMALVKKYIAADEEKWFCFPVDAVALGIPDYHDIIKFPMDLGTVLKNIESHSYNTVDEVLRDLRLTFTNAVDYNPADNPVAKAARKLLDKLELWQEDEKKPHPSSKIIDVVDLSSGSPYVISKRKTKKVASLFLKPGRSKRKHKQPVQVKTKKPRFEEENIVDVSNTRDVEPKPLSNRTRPLKKGTKINPFFHKREKKTTKSGSLTQSKKPMNVESGAHWNIVEFPPFATEQLPVEETTALRRSYPRTIEAGDWVYQSSSCDIESANELVPKYTANRTIFAQSEREDLMSSQSFLELSQSLFPCKDSLDEQRVRKTLRGLSKSNSNLWSEVYGAILKGRQGRDGHALKDWLKSWDEVLEQEFSGSDSDCLDGLTRALALVGPSGLGKTQLVYNLAHKLKYKVIEAGTCVRRSSADLLAMIGECAQSNTMNNNRRGKDKALILVDDFDIVFDQDKGFFSALKSLISRTKVPIVLTCTVLPKEFDSHDSGVCVVLCDTPTLRQVSEDLAYVCLAEGICLQREIIDRLVRMYTMDLRRILNELQFYCFRRGIEDDKPLEQSKQMHTCPPSWFDKVWDLEVGLSRHTSNHLQQMIRYAPALNAYNALYDVDISEQPTGTISSVSVTKLEPRKGAITGGTIVKIHGRGFLSGDYIAVDVFVGDTRATDTWILSDTDIVFRTPSYPNWEALSAEPEDEKRKRDEVDEIEEFSDAEDFEIPRPKICHARVGPCGVVVRCRRADGSVIASDDLVEERYKFLFSYRFFEPATTVDVDIANLKSGFVPHTKKAPVSNASVDLEEMAMQLEKLSSFDTAQQVVHEHFCLSSVNPPSSQFLKSEVQWRSSAQGLLSHAKRVLGNTSFRRAYGVSRSPNARFFTQLLPTLRKINSIEKQRKKLSVSRRFMHYFDRINLYDIDPNLADCFEFDQ